MYLGKTMSLHAIIAEAKRRILLGVPRIKGQEGEVIAQGPGKCTNHLESSGESYIECTINGKKVDIPEADYYTIYFEPSAKVKVNGSMDMVNFEIDYDIEAEGNVTISQLEEGSVEVTVG